MAQSIPFGARSTADQVLAGVDLTRKRMVVTGRVRQKKDARAYSKADARRTTNNSL
jgi:hypothetical protein